MRCGCYVDLKYVDIVYCPKHQSAPDMYEALKVLNEQCYGANMPFSQAMFDAKKNARQALALAEGKTP